MFVSFGWVNCIGVFQAEYETNQLKEYSSSEVAWITSLECKTYLLVSAPFNMLTLLQVFFMLAFLPVAGTLFDSYRPRVPILVGSFMRVFGLMMTSISSTCYQIMLSQSVCSRIRSSLIFTPLMTAVGCPFEATVHAAPMLERPTWYAYSPGHGSARSAVLPVVLS